MNRKYGTIYVDFTGKLPIRSMDGMVAIFIIYDWTTKAIIENPVNNMKEETIVECFKQNMKYLPKRNFKPVLNIIDNVTSRAVRAYLENENVDIQLVKLRKHCVSAVERAVQNFKTT